MSRKKHRTLKVSVLLILALILAGILSVLAIQLNIRNIKAKEAAKQEEEDTIVATASTVDSQYTNQYYTIGYNPTEVNQEYFRELDEAVESGDELNTALSVVKCFVSEFYTWSNKDGGYDVGGMQYIYSEKQSDFESTVRNGFYENLDLYLTQIGREHLQSVSAVNIVSYEPETYEVALPADTSEMADAEDREAEVLKLESYAVEASWEYNRGYVDVSDFQSEAVFHVVNNNGRWEIGGIDEIGGDTDE